MMKSGSENIWKLSTATRVDSNTVAPSAGQVGSNSTPGDDKAATHQQQWQLSGQHDTIAFGARHVLHLVSTCCHCCEGLKQEGA